MKLSDLFAWDYHGEPFVLFGAAHSIALGIILLLNLSFLFLRSEKRAAWRKPVRVTMAVVLIANELGWHLWNFLNGQWTVQTMLPLHLCSVFVFLSAWMLLTRNYSIYEFAYFLGIGGALQALLTPDAGIYGFPHYRFLQTMISHGLIVSASVYMTLVEGFRPSGRSLLKVLVWGNVYMVSVLIINQLLGSNYMYLAHKPATASALDLLGPWPIYLVWLEVIALGVFSAFYLPFAWIDRRKKRSSATL